MEQNAVQADCTTREEFKLLQTQDEYSLYFRHLRHVFQKLLEVFII